MSSITVISTVRHGDTEFNHQKRYAGLIDVPLSSKGLDDARAAARHLNVSADVVVSSGLRRAVDTARALVGQDREIVQCELCNERNFGAMQGLTSDEVEGLRPVVTFFRMGGDFHSLDPPEGESFPALRQRVEAFAEYLMREFAGDHILVVSHEVFLLQFHGLLRGESWQEAMAHRLPNLTLTTLTMRDGQVEDETSRPLVGRLQEDGSFFTCPPATTLPEGPVD